MDGILTSVYCVVDDFCKEFEKAFEDLLLPASSNSRRRASRLSIAELMTILICFQLSGHRTFKHYYKFLKRYHSLEFPKLVSYQRLVEIMPKALIPLTAFFEFARGEENDCYFIDSTPISVCKCKRIFSHKVFQGLAERGKNTMGWFFGFKLHLIINSDMDPIAFKVTKGNRDDRSVLAELCANLRGKIYGDKGYISKEHFKNLFACGLQLITSLRTNMKPQIMSLEDSAMLNKRSCAESAYNVLKNNMHLEHSRHRSVANFMVNLLGALSAYAIRKVKQLKHSFLAN